jgi:hypothetical protein
MKARSRPCSERNRRPFSDWVGMVALTA